MVRSIMSSSTRKTAQSQIGRVSRQHTFRGRLHSWSQRQSRLIKKWKGQVISKNRFAFLACLPTCQTLCQCFSGKDLLCALLKEIGLEAEQSPRVDISVSEEANNLNSCSRLFRYFQASSHPNRCLIERFRIIWWMSSCLHITGLTDAETRYAQIDKELLAIVFICGKSHRSPVNQQAFRVIRSRLNKYFINIFTPPCNSATIHQCQHSCCIFLKFKLWIEYVRCKHIHFTDTVYPKYASIPLWLTLSTGSARRFFTVHMVLYNTTSSYGMLSLLPEAIQRYATCQSLWFVAIDPAYQQIISLIQT